MQDNPQREPSNLLGQKAFCAIFMKDFSVLSEEELKKYKQKLSESFLALQRTVFCFQKAQNGQLASITEADWDRGVRGLKPHLPGNHWSEEEILYYLKLFAKNEQLHAEIKRFLKSRGGLVCLAKAFLGKGFLSAFPELTFDRLQTYLEMEEKNTPSAVARAEIALRQWNQGADRAQVQVSSQVPNRLGETPALPLDSKYAGPLQSSLPLQFSFGSAENKEISSENPKTDVPRVGGRARKVKPSQAKDLSKGRNAFYAIFLPEKEVFSPDFMKKYRVEVSTLDRQFLRLQFAVFCFEKALNKQLATIQPSHFDIPRGKKRKHTADSSPHLPGPEWSEQQMLDYLKLFAHHEALYPLITEVVSDKIRKLKSDEDPHRKIKIRHLSGAYLGRESSQRDSSRISFEKLHFHLEDFRRPSLIPTAQVTRAVEALREWQLQRKSSSHAQKSSEDAKKSSTVVKTPVGSLPDADDPFDGFADLSEQSPSPFLSAFSSSSLASLSASLSSVLPPSSSSSSSSEQSSLSSPSLDSIFPFPASPAPLSSFSQNNSKSLEAGASPTEDLGAGRNAFEEFSQDFPPLKKARHVKEKEEANGEEESIFPAKVSAESLFDADFDVDAVFGGLTELPAQPPSFPLPPPSGLPLLSLSSSQQEDPLPVLLTPPPFPIQENPKPAQRSFAAAGHHPRFFAGSQEQNGQQGFVVARDQPLTQAPTPEAVADGASAADQGSSSQLLSQLASYARHFSRSVQEQQKPSGSNNQRSDQQAVVAQEFQKQGR